MSRSVFKIAVVLIVAAFVGCGGGNEPAQIPKDLNQSLPKVAAPVGGGGETPKQKKKDATPGQKAD